MKLTIRRLMPVVAFLCAYPGLAFAHPGGPALHSWSAGFNHPLHGWDHMVVMIAVGAWAAQRGGKAIWALPLAFLSVMALGGVAGANGVRLAGAEVMIGISVIAFGLLVLARARVNLAAAVATVGLFAFFHGYAHGVEIPDAAGLWTYGLGLMVATVLLHGLGVLAVAGVSWLASVREGCWGCYKSPVTPGKLWDGYLSHL